MFVQAIFAHFGRQNRLFEQNATEREKTQDWLAEGIGFELRVTFFQYTPFRAYSFQSQDTSSEGDAQTGGHGRSIGRVDGQAR